MRAVPGRPSPQPITARPGAAQNAERAPARPLWRPRASRGRSQNWAAKGPPQLTDTRAAEAERVLREHLSESGPEAPERRTPSRGAAVRLQGTGLLIPGQRPGGREHRMGPGLPHPLQASSSPQAPGPALRSLSRSRAGGMAGGWDGRWAGTVCVVRYEHCRRPAEGLTAPG